MNYDSIEVVPSVCNEKTFRDVEEKLSILKGVSETVHIDVSDGRFTQEASWPLLKPDINFEEIINEERGMPGWEDFDFEFHLMVKDPLSHIQDFIKAGASKIVMHAEAIDLQNDRLLLDQIRTEGAVEIGIAFKLQTGVERMAELLPYADFIVFMSIEHLGFQGQKFDERVLDKIKWLKNELPTMPIVVDGGITPDTALLAYEAGATKFIVGSYVLNSVNPIESMREIKNII